MFTRYFLLTRFSRPKQIGAHLEDRYLSAAGHTKEGKKVALAARANAVSLSCPHSSYTDLKGDDPNRRYVCDYCCRFFGVSPSCCLHIRVYHGPVSRVPLFCYDCSNLIEPGQADDGGAAAASPSGLVSVRDALERTGPAPEQVLAMLDDMPNVENALSLMVDIDHFLTGAHNIAEVSLFRAWSRS